MAKNVQVIGANCTLGPQALLPILQELTEVDDLRVSGMPNAGFQSAKATASSIQNLRRNISRSSRAKPPLSACVFSAAAAAPRPRTFALWLKPSSRCVLRNPTPRHHSVEVVAKPALDFATRTRKQILEKTPEERIHRLRRNRSAERPLARPHLRAGRQDHGLGQSGRH